MLKWKVSQRPSSVEFVETTDGSLVPSNASHQHQQEEVLNEPRFVESRRKPPVLVKYVSSPTGECGEKHHRTMEPVSIGKSSGKRKFGKHQKQRALDGSENKENSAAGNFPTDSSKLHHSDHHHQHRAHHLNLSRGPLTVFCPTKEPSNANSDGTAVNRLSHRGQSAGRKSSAASKGAWTHKGLLRPSCNPMRLFSSDDYQRNDSDSGSMSYMTLEKLPVALQMQREFGAAKRPFDRNAAQSGFQDRHQDEVPQHVFRTSGDMDHPPKVGGWDSNATYVSSSFNEHEQSRQEPSNKVADVVQLRSATAAASKTKQKWKRASWAIKPFSFNFSSSSTSSTSVPVSNASAGGSSQASSAEASTLTSNNKPKAFTDAPATMANSVIRPVPIKSFSPPSSEQHQLQLQTRDQPSWVQPGNNSSASATMNVSMDMCEPDLLLPAGKCMFSNKFQDNQKPLPRYGFHFNMLPAKKMCQASTGQHIHVRHTSKPLPNALAGLRKPLPLPPVPPLPIRAPSSGASAVPTGCVQSAQSSQPVTDGNGMGQRSASTSSIAKPPRKTKSKKRLSVVQEVSKEITPSEAGDMTLRSTKSDGSSSAGSSNRTRITHPSSEMSSSTSSSADGVCTASANYVNLPPLSCRPSSTTVVSAGHHDYMNLPPLPDELEKRDSPGKVKQQYRFAPTLPQIDPIFRIRTQQQIDARRKCISALETDEILAGLDVLAHDITPSLTVKPLAENGIRFSNEAGNRRPFSRYHHQQSHHDTSSNGVKKMLNMSAGGSDGTDSGVISESALSPSFTSRTLISPFSDSLLEEPVVLDELFSSSNAICAEIYDADSSTTLGTSRTSAGTVVTAIRKSPAAAAMPPALLARKKRSRSLTEIRHFAKNTRDPSQNPLESEMAAADDSGCCWLYENHDAVLHHLADAQRRSNEQTGEWYASESPLKFTGPKVGRTLRRSNSLYSSYSNLVEHLLFRPEAHRNNVTTAEATSTSRDRPIHHQSMLGKEDSFWLKSGELMGSPLRLKSMTLPHLADITSAHPGNQSPANCSNLSVEAVLGSSSPPESSIVSWYNRLESSVRLPSTSSVINHRHVRHRHTRSHQVSLLPHRRMSLDDDDHDDDDGSEAPFYENVTPDSRPCSPALSDASSLLRDGRAAAGSPKGALLETTLCDAFSCSMSIKDDASTIGDLNETPMVFRCSEYSWTTAHASTSHRDLDAESVASSSDMRVVDVSAPSQYWESDYSQLSCSGLTLANSGVVTSETESWDSHATYRYFRRGSGNLPDVIKRSPSSSVVVGAAMTRGKRKHQHVSKVAKLVEIQRLQELTKKMKDVRDTLLDDQTVNKDAKVYSPFPSSVSATSLTTGSVERKLRRRSSSVKKASASKAATSSAESSGKPLKRSERSKIWLEPKGKSVPDVSRADIFDQSREDDDIDEDEDEGDEEPASATDLFAYDDSPLTEEASEGNLETPRCRSASKSPARRIDLIVTPNQTVVKRTKVDLRDGRGLAMITPVSTRRKRLLMRRPSFAAGCMSATKVTRSSKKPKASVKRLKNKRVGRIGGMKCDDFNRGQVKLAIYENFGLLTIHVMEAKNLRSSNGGKCNSYVKLSLLPDAEDRTFCRTDIVRAANAPNFNERFSFEFLDGDLEKRLMISLWNRSSGSRRGEFLGCLSFKVKQILNNREYGWFWLLKKSHGRRRHVPVKPSLAANSGCESEAAFDVKVHDQPLGVASVPPQHDKLQPASAPEPLLTQQLVEPVVATPMLPPRAEKGRRSINSNVQETSSVTNASLLLSNERSVPFAPSGSANNNFQEETNQCSTSHVIRDATNSSQHLSVVSNSIYGSVTAAAGCVLSKKEFFERSSRLCSEGPKGSSSSVSSSSSTSSSSPADRRQVAFSSKVGCGTLV